MARRPTSTTGSVIVLFLVAVFAIGCSATVSGHGVSLRGPSSASSSSNGGLSTPPSAGCGADWISPRSSPYCFPLPQGFADHSDASGYGAGWQYKSLVSIGAQDLVAVYASNVGVNLDLLGPAQRMSYFYHQELHADEAGVETVGPLTPTTVGGISGYKQEILLTDQVRLIDMVVLHGEIEVGIRCASIHFVAQVAAACETIARSIKIADR